MKEKVVNNMKNKLVDLNNHLFEQLERLNDEELSPEKLKQEISRAKAMASIGKVVVENANTVLDAKKYVDELGLEKNEMPEILCVENQ